MENAEISTEHFDNGFKDATENVLKHFVGDMYKERAEAFKVAAGRGLSLEDLSKYRDGYNAGMIREIEHLGARGAIRDHDNGGVSTKRLAEQLAVIKWLKEPEHVKAFSEGYKKRADLDIGALNVSSLNKKQENTQSVNFEKGYWDSEVYTRNYGVKAAIEALSVYIGKIKGVFAGEKEHNQYVEGYKSGVRDQVHQLAEKLATSVVKDKGDVTPKVNEHYKMARESLNKELFSEFNAAYRGTLTKLSTKHQLKVGDKIEVRQVRSGPSLSR